MKKHIKGILSIMLAGFMALGMGACKSSGADSSSGIGNSSNEATGSLSNTYVNAKTSTARWSDGSDFTPVLRFVVGSDIHIRDWYTAQAEKRFGDMFDDMYAYAATQEYDKVDAFIMVGDLTETGTDIQLDKLVSVAQEKIKQEESVLLMPYAGHDILTYYDKTIRDYTIPHEDLISRMESYTGTESGAHLTINGFHFITMSTMKVSQLGSDGELMPGYQEEWVKEQLANAEEDNPLKPIFAFYHHPISDTVVDSQTDSSISSDQYYNPALYGKQTFNDFAPVITPILEDYTQLVYFSGHTHVAVKNPLSIVQDKYTTINTGAINYANGSSNNFKFGDGADTNKSYGRSSISTVSIVEVDENYRIRILPYNVSLRQFHTDIGENSGEQLIRYIEDAGNPDTWLYKKDERMAAADVPTWVEGQEISVVQTGNKLSISWTQAIDRDGTDSYWVVVRDKNKSAGEVSNMPDSGDDVVKRYAVWSQICMEPAPDTVKITYEVTDATKSYPLQNDYLPAGEYTISIVPYDVYGKKGETLTTDFTVV